MIFLALYNLMKYSTEGMLISVESFKSERRFPVFNTQFIPSYPLFKFVVNLNAMEKSTIDHPTQPLSYFSQDVAAPWTSNETVASKFPLAHTLPMKPFPARAR